MRTVYSEHVGKVVFLEAMPKERDEGPINLTNQANAIGTNAVKHVANFEKLQVNRVETKVGEEGEYAKERKDETA